ncbi:MAG: hypothetical protein ABI877_17820 [Gemmatimonadaceae bacterium]
MSSPDVEALEDDFVSLSMAMVKKELPDKWVLGLYSSAMWLCEQPSDHAAPNSY